MKMNGGNGVEQSDGFTDGEKLRGESYVEEDERKR